MNKNQKPTIILINPQLGENMGAAARVMHNFALTDLRIVAPRDGWPNEAATAMAANAKHLIEQAQLFDTVEDAIADCHTVYATTARERAMNKPVIELPFLCVSPPAETPHAERSASTQSHALGNDTDSSEQEWTQNALQEAAPSVVLETRHIKLACFQQDEPVSSRRSVDWSGKQQKSSEAQGQIQTTAILFGPERTGLINEHIALADAVLTIPANPEYPSLNLAQAVGLVCYEWFSVSNGDTVLPLVASQQTAMTPDFRIHQTDSARNEATTQSRAAHSEHEALDRFANARETENGKPQENYPTHDQLQHFFDHLESALDDAQFWKVPEKKDAMMRNIRTSLQRAQPNEQELQTWHGMIKALISSKRH